MCLIGFAILGSLEVYTLGQSLDGGVVSVFLDSVIALAVAILSGLASKLLIKGIQKAGLQIDISKKILIEDAVQKGIRFAAEHAAKKQKLDKLVLKGEEKLEIAATRVVEKIPEISKEEAKKLVEEGLADAFEGATTLVANLTKATKKKK